MGNSNKKPEEYDVVRSFRQDEWINKQKRLGYEIWENTSKNMRADVYPVTTEIKANDMQHYQMRHNNSKDIVKVHHLRLDKDPSLCSKSADAHVFVQRIPYRLTDVNDLSQPEALSVLRSAYSGFNTISTFYGPVQPYQDMICFNEQGKTKVWINSNLALNRVEKQAQSHNVRDSVNINQAYVNKIFDMVQNKTAIKSLPQYLRNRFRQQNPKTYFQALNIVQQYAAQNGLPIPSAISPKHCQNQQFVNQLQNSTSKVQSYNYINGPVQSSNSLVNQSNTSIHNAYGQQSQTQGVVTPTSTLTTVGSVHQGGLLPVGSTANTITGPTQQNIRSSTVLSSPNIQPLVGSVPLRSTMPAQSVYSFAGSPQFQDNSIVRRTSQKSFIAEPFRQSIRRDLNNNTVSSNVVYNRPNINMVSSPVRSSIGGVQYGSRVNANSGYTILPPQQNTGRFVVPPSPTQIRFDSPSKVTQHQVFTKPFSSGLAPVYQSQPLQSQQSSQVQVQQQVQVQPQNINLKKAQSPIKSVSGQQGNVLITEAAIQASANKEVSEEQRRLVEQQRLKQQTPGSNKQIPSPTKLAQAPLVQVSQPIQSQPQPISIPIQSQPVHGHGQITVQQFNGQIIRQTMHMNTQPHLQIQGGQQVQPNFAMPLNVQYKYGYSNQPHPINYGLFSNNIQQQNGQAVKQGLQMMPLVQQQIQAGYPQQQQQNKYNIIVAPQQQVQGQVQGGQGQQQAQVQQSQQQVQQQSQGQQNVKITGSNIISTDNRSQQQRIQIQNSSTRQVHAVQPGRPQSLQQSIQLQKQQALSQQQQPKSQPLQPTPQVQSVVKNVFLNTGELQQNQRKLRNTYSQYDQGQGEGEQQQDNHQQFADEVEKQLDKLEEDQLYDRQQHSQQQYNGQQEQEQREQQDYQQEYQAIPATKEQVRQSTQQTTAQVATHQAQRNQTQQKQSQQIKQTKQQQVGQVKQTGQQVKTQQVSQKQQMQPIQSRQIQSQQYQQLQQIQQQHTQKLDQKLSAGSSQGNQNNYFPFSNQQQVQGHKEDDQFNIQQIKRVATMEITQLSMPESAQTSPRQQQINRTQLQQIKQKTQQSEVEQPHQPTYKASWEAQNQQLDQINSSYGATVGGGYEYQYKKRNPQPQIPQDQRIPDNARYQDIQAYIRNKYKTYIGVSEESDFRPSSSVSPYAYSGRDNQAPDVKDMASYVQSKYDEYSYGANANANTHTYNPNVYDNTNYDNNQINFSFKPKQPIEQLAKPPLPPTAPAGSYSYMRVQHDYNKYHQDSPSEVKAQRQQVQRRVSGPKQPKKQHKNPDDDMLDVGYLERSLDKKYSSIKSQQQIKGSTDSAGKKEQGGFEFDVAKMEQNLIRFQQSRVGSGGHAQQRGSNTSGQPRFQTSQVSKINSIDYRLGHERRSSVQKDLNFDHLSNNYGISNSPESYENQSPIYQYEKRSSARVEKRSSNIDQKYNKYVKKLNNQSSSHSSKAILRQKQQNYDYKDNDYGNSNNYYDSSSRMATGHFGYTENSKDGYGSGRGSGANANYTAKNYKTNTTSNGYGNNYEYQTKKTTFVTSEVTSPQGLSYEDLRKFMWS